MIIASAIIVVALSLQPPQIPQEKGASESSSAQNTATPERADKSQKPSQALPDKVSTASQPSSQTDSSHAASEEENESVQRRIEIFTGVLAVVGVLQLVVMFLTWRVYHRQAGIMSHQAEEMARQRIAIDKQLEVMQGQLRQMENSSAQTDQLISEARKSAEAAKAAVDAQLSAERPWVSITVRRTVKSISNSLGVFRDISYFELVLKNWGRTPALVIAMHNRHENSSKGVDGGFCSRAEPDYGLPTTFTHVKLMAPKEEWIPETDDILLNIWALPSDLQDEIRDGKKHRIIWGAVFYSDLLRPGIVHDTRYCFTYLRILDDYRPSGPSQYTRYT